MDFRMHSKKKWVARPLSSKDFIVLVVCLQKSCCRDNLIPANVLEVYLHFGFFCNKETTDIHPFSCSTFCCRSCVLLFENSGIYRDNWGVEQCRVGDTFSALKLQWYFIYRMSKILWKGPRCNGCPDWFKSVRFNYLGIFNINWGARLIKKKHFWH